MSSERGSNTVRRGESGGGGGPRPRYDPETRASLQTAIHTLLDVIGGSSARPPLPGRDAPPPLVASPAYRDGRGSTSSGNEQGDRGRDAARRPGRMDFDVEHVSSYSPVDHLRENERSEQCNAAYPPPGGGERDHVDESRRRAPQQQKEHADAGPARVEPWRVGQSRGGDRDRDGKREKREDYNKFRRDWARRQQGPQDHFHGPRNERQGASAFLSRAVLSGAEAPGNGKEENSWNSWDRSSKNQRDGRGRDAGDKNFWHKQGTSDPARGAWYNSRAATSGTGNTQDHQRGGGRSGRYTDEKQHHHHHHQEQWGPPASWGRQRQLSPSGHTNDYFEVRIPTDVVVACVSNMPENLHDDEISELAKSLGLHRLGIVKKTRFCGIADFLRSAKAKAPHAKEDTAPVYARQIYKAAQDLDLPSPQGQEDVGQKSVSDLSCRANWTNGGRGAASISSSTTTGTATVAPAEVGGSQVEEVEQVENEKEMLVRRLLEKLREGEGGGSTTALVGGRSSGAPGGGDLQLMKTLEGYMNAHQEQATGAESQAALARCDANNSTNSDCPGAPPPSGSSGRQQRGLMRGKADPPAAIITLTGVLAFQGAAPGKQGMTFLVLYSEHHSPGAKSSTSTRFAARRKVEEVFDVLEQSLQKENKKKGHSNRSTNFQPRSGPATVKMKDFLRRRVVFEFPAELDGQLVPLFGLKTPLATDRPTSSSAAGESGRISPSQDDRHDSASQKLELEEKEEDEERSSTLEEVKEKSSSSAVLVSSSAEGAGQGEGEVVQEEIAQNYSYKYTTHAELQKMIARERANGLAKLAVGDQVRKHQKFQPGGTSRGAEAMVLGTVGEDATISPIDGDWIFTGDREAVDFLTHSLFRGKEIDANRAQQKFGRTISDKEKGWIANYLQRVTAGGREVANEENKKAPPLHLPGVAAPVSARTVGDVFLAWFMDRGGGSPRWLCAGMPKNNCLSAVGDVEQESQENSGEHEQIASQEKVSLIPLPRFFWHLLGRRDHLERHRLRFMVQALQLCNSRPKTAEQSTSAAACSYFLSPKVNWQCDRIVREHGRVTYVCSHEMVTTRVRATLMQQVGGGRWSPDEWREVSYRGTSFGLGDGEQEHILTRGQTVPGGTIVVDAQHHEPASCPDLLRSGTPTKVEAGEEEDGEEDPPDLGELLGRRSRRSDCNGGSTEHKR